MGEILLLFDGALAAAVELLEDAVHRLRADLQLLPQEKRPVEDQRLVALVEVVIGHGLFAGGVEHLKAQTNFVVLRAEADGVDVGEVLVDAYL